MHAPISMALAAAISPEHVRGRYLAAFQYSFTFASIIGPAFFTSLFGLARPAPWLVLAVLDIASAAVIVLLERRIPAQALATPAEAHESRSA